MSTYRKYELLRSYFGISGIKLSQPKNDPNAPKIPLKVLRSQVIDQGHVIRPQNYDALYNVCEILTQKAPEKRTDKERQIIRHLICKMNFFQNQPNNQKEKLDLDEITNYIKYKRKEAGETLFKQGDKADNYYIVLKGTLQVQVPSPFTEHIFIPEEPKKEIKTKKDTKKISNLKALVLQSRDGLTQEELQELTPLEMKKYKTRTMLNEILSSKDIFRKTVSPW